MGGQKVRRLVGAVRDKAWVAKATMMDPPSSSAALTAVVRATSQAHPSSPPHPRHVDALLSFGHGSRPSATALASCLSSRLLSTSDPSVALKSLLCAHLLLRSAPFILLDALRSSLLPKPCGRLTRCPLLLSSFPLGPDPLAWSLSSCVRWYSRLLELRLALPDTSSTLPVSSLLTPRLASDLDAIVQFLVQASSPPDLPSQNSLLASVLTAVNQDRISAEDEILVHLAELRQRIGALGFADALELVCVIRRLEDLRPYDPDWMDEKRRCRFWNEADGVRALVEAAVVRMEKEARRVRRERSAAVSDRFGLRTSDRATLSVPLEPLG